jgi:hypothetical protein
VVEIQGVALVPVDEVGGCVASQLTH